MAALALPMAASSAPDRRADPAVTRALYAPRAKSVAAEARTDTHPAIAIGSRAKVPRGRREPTREERPTIVA
jgi:hypothetical protein